MGNVGTCCDRLQYLHRKTTPIQRKTRLKYEKQTSPPSRCCPTGRRLKFSYGTCFLCMLCKSKTKTCTPCYTWADFSHPLDPHKHLKPRGKALAQEKASKICLLPTASNSQALLYIIYLLLHVHVQLLSA